MRSGKTWMPVWAITIIWLLSLSGVAFAQSPQVPVNTPYQLQFAHDGTGVTGQTGAGWRCFLDGVKQGNDLPPTSLVNGTITCSYPAIPTAGSHSLQASAFNANGESKSASLAFTTFVPQPPPPAPSGLKILINGVQVAADGTQTPVKLLVTIQP